jgi:hypothetical protein
MHIEASAPTEAATVAGILRAVMSALETGKIEQATGYFGDQFVFNDYGIGLDFRDRKRLMEFFRKERTLYRDSKRHLNAIFVDGSHAVGQWTLRATALEPWFGELTREVPICIHGTSVAQIENDTIVAWSDYYDSLASRRTALAAHFAEWVEA